MNKTIVLASIAVASVTTGIIWFYQARIAISEIEYLGETFKLPKRYYSYESYRNDPENFGALNLKRVQELVQGHSISGAFDSLDSFGKSAFALKVPGYGMSNIPVESCNSMCTLLAIEVPGTKKWRYLLAVQKTSRLVVIDDFVHEGPRFTQVVVENEMIKYKSLHTTLRERQL